MSVVNVDGKRLNNIIQNAKNLDIPIFVYYWAEWCGPCKQQGPVMEKLAKELDGEALFMKINSDENLQTAAANNVMSLPTIHIYSKGEIVKEFKGAQSAKRLEKALADLTEN